MVMKKLLKSIFGDPNERDLKRYREVVEVINSLEAQMKALTNEQLRAKTDEFRQRLADGETLDDLLPEAFAVVREASVRTIGLRHYDVQLIGGMVLHDGKIAEMKTGEGKTLVATLPLYLNALTGRGAHLVTPNDYLSKFGLQSMGPIYHFLGLRAAVIQNAAADPSRGSFLYDPTFASDDDRYQYLRPISRREAYEADITYGTNNEFGFDYLRDNMVRTKDEMVQRGHVYAIVDEVDNILIDEARTPLIISGVAEQPREYYQLFAKLVRDLRPSSEESIAAKAPDGDYVEDPKTRTVFLTEQGTEKIEQRLRRAGLLQGDELYAPENSEMIPYLDNSLRALVIYERDKDYMVENGQVIIVDEFTGRPMYGRRFAEGLHQAIEAKEGVTVQRENMTLATITFQNYFRLYEKVERHDWHGAHRGG
jgi:preprotein translocase subunit SecA